MAIRYCGNATVRIAYLKADFQDTYYKATVSVDGHCLWSTSDLRAPRCGFGEGVAHDSPQAYDEMAEGALAFASHYDGVGDSSRAEAVNNACEWAEDGSGRVMRRKKKQ